MNPTEMTPVGRYYVDNLPYWPYCAKGLGALYKRPREQYKYYTHIEHNEPTLVRWLVFDIDYNINIGAFIWDQRSIPVPNIIVRNPANGHAHFFYKLSNPVSRSDGARQGPLRYLAHIENGMCELLKADRGYSGLISKNPFHGDWQTWFVHNTGFELCELDDFVPESCYIRSKAHSETYGLGRNCTVFECLKQWAYRAFRDDFDYSTNGWYDACLSQAFEFNRDLCLESPLPVSEIKAIAKSVSKWVAMHFKPRDFKIIQASRGKRKGKEMRAQFLERVLDYARKGLKPKEIVHSIPELTVSVVNAWLRRYRGPI